MNAIAFLDTPPPADLRQIAGGVVLLGVGILFYAGDVQQLYRQQYV